MDRREFFKLGLNNVAKATLNEAERRAKKKAQRFIRPPFAIDELDFLLACTRCNACIEACPHQVIFPLSVKLGVQEAATPALDLLNKGCHLCQDWPCVTACEPGALLRPLEASEEEEEPIPAAVSPLAKASIDPGRCLPYSGPECGACQGSCPVPNALTWDGEKPRIDESVCLGCALCREACILASKAVTIRSLRQDDL
ncbi:MAG: 4Fe-4S binding protein [Motiliproteus sp.]